MNKEDIVFIEHILECIANIELFLSGVSKEEFFDNKEKQSAVVHQIEVIGEAAKNLTKEFRDKYPQVEWKEAIGTRDKIIHHYFGVDLETVWETVKINLPKLKEQMLKIKKEIQ